MKIKPKQLEPMFNQFSELHDPAAMRRGAQHFIEISKSARFVSPVVKGR